ncbi:MAG: hypothetical protein RLZ12_138 [Bacillota bacterium]
MSSKKKELILANTNATAALARAIADLLEPGDVVALDGPLGAGKTFVAQRIAARLGVKEIVTSPTFLLIKEYNGRWPIYHIDAYRIPPSEQGFFLEEYFYGEGVSIVEWATRIVHILPKGTIYIKMEVLSNSSRLATIATQKPNVLPCITAWESTL